MQISVLDHTDEKRLEEWDAFQQKSPRGHYCQLSTWLKSFSSYGFEFKIITVTENDRIVGGIGFVYYRKPFFCAISVPIGPIVEVGYESLTEQLLENVIQFAKKSKATLLQLRFPCADGIDIPNLLQSIPVVDKIRSYSGTALSVAFAPNEMLLIDFPKVDEPSLWQEQLMNRFSPNTRRNIRYAEKHGLKVHEVQTPDEMREAYSLIERNGVEQGYATRKWEDFGVVMAEQIRRGHAVVLLARKDGQNLGAHYGVIAGQRYSYIMGATTRGEKDFKVGHFLQWSAMNRARAAGALSYDFTSRGSKSVFEFKMGFRPQHISFVEPRYYVFSPFRFLLFKRIYPWARKHKILVSKILSFMKKP